MYYVVQVEASDLGQAARSSDVSVIVRVNDVNDNAPVININTLSSHSALLANNSTGLMPLAVVPENLASGTFVAHVTVSDDDQADNSRVVCDVMSRDSAFQLVPRHYNEYQANI